MYQHKDHLGNVRLSYADVDGNSTINPVTEILEVNNYYPFGLQHTGYGYIDNAHRSEEAEQYKYLDKEYENTYNLNVIETDFRQYDPALGRFVSIDLLSELAPNYTPYRYGFNNPNIFTDPTGLYEIDANGNIRVTDPYEIGLLYNYLNHNSNASYNSIAEFMSNADNGFSLDLPEIVMTMQGGKITGGGAAIHSNVQNALDLISSFNGRVNVFGVDINKFGIDFFGAEESNLKSASAMIGHAGLHLTKTEALLQYVGATEGVLKSAKSIGIKLGYAGVLTTAIEDLANNNLGVGTGVKVAIGVASMYLGPVGVAYAIIDLSFGVTTGTTLTDRIANGVENSFK